jgi:AraC-like DNA-binding protein
MDVMLEILRHQLIYRSPTVSVVDVCCRPHGGECGQEEQSSVPEIVFPRAGAFIRHVGGRCVLADANHVLFFNGGEPYRVSHPIAGGDDCTAFSFDAGILGEAVARLEPAAWDRPDRPFSVTHCLADRRSVVLQQGLRRCAAGLRRADVAADELALDLLDAVLAGAAHSPPKRSNGVRSQTQRAHAEIVGAARTVIARHFREPLTLEDIAGAIPVSSYHLARIFRRIVGMPVHRYLNRLRLRASLECLAESAGNLTLIALDLGFASHSHFTDVFRGEFGLPPSAFRDGLTTGRLRQMSKNLEA